MAKSKFTTEDLPGEQWKPIPAWEGIYEISDRGRVKRIRGGKGTRAGRIRTGQLNIRSGYLFIRLADRERMAQPDIHVLVATAFIGPCPLGFTVNHKDGVKTHNTADNFEYLTRGDNVRHAARIGLLPRGMDRPFAKLTDNNVREIRVRLAAGEQGKHIAKDYKVDPMQISCIKRGITWNHVK